MSGNLDLPLVAIVGRPNVGKSTLYNRLVGGRPALVEDTPGVTRDRRYGEAEFAGRKFRVVDTGGLDPLAEAGAIQAGIHRQAFRAFDEASVLIFVCDAREGLTTIDREVAGLLRKSGRKVLTVANKVDAQKQEELVHEIHELGLGEVYGVSAAHGRGLGDLLDAILEALPKVEKRKRLNIEEAAAEDVADKEAAAANRPLRITFVGKPNVGKSSLVNKLLGEERVLVHDKPGTTTDPVDTPFEIGGKKFVLVDTAGMRRKSRVDLPTEKISVSMALGQIERADVAILVIDAHEGPSEQDAKIADAIETAGRGVLVVVNKDDLLPAAKREEEQKKLRDKFSDVLTFLSWAPIMFTSAKTGHAVPDIVAAATEVWEAHSKRVGTAELNRFFAEVCETTPPPTLKGRPVRIHYLTQSSVQPPTFLLFANRPDLVHHAYRRFLVNQLRARFGFKGSPIRVVTKRKAGRDR